MTTKLASYIEPDYRRKSLKMFPKKKRVLVRQAVSVDSVLNTKVKNIFEYYTGLSYVRFIMLALLLIYKWQAKPCCI